MDREERSRTHRNEARNVEKTGDTAETRRMALHQREEIGINQPSSPAPDTAHEPDTRTFPAQRFSDANLRERQISRHSEHRAVANGNESPKQRTSGDPVPEPPLNGQPVFRDTSTRILEHENSGADRTSEPTTADTIRAPVPASPRIDGESTGQIQKRLGDSSFSHDRQVSQGDISDRLKGKRRDIGTASAESKTAPSIPNVQLPESSPPMEAAKPIAREIGPRSHERFAGAESGAKSEKTASEGTAQTGGAGIGTFVSMVSHAQKTSSMTAAMRMQASQEVARKLERDFNQDNNEGLTAAQTGYKAYRKAKDNSQQRTTKRSSQTRSETRQQTSRRQMKKDQKPKASEEAAQKEYARMLEKKRMRQRMTAQRASSGGTSSASAGASAKAASRVAAKGGAAAAKTSASAVMPYILLAVVIILVIILLFNMLAALFTGMYSGFMVTAVYHASDESLNGAELWYSEQEAILKENIINTPVRFPGYNEYRYNIDPIGHDPYELLAYLTAKLNEFTLDEAMAEMQRLFNIQYELSYESITEMHGWGEWVYPWNVLIVTLKSKPFSEVIELDEEQSQAYEVYKETRGLRQYVFSPLSHDWLPSIKRPYGWSFDEETLEKVYNNGVDIVVGYGTPVHAAMDGVVTSILYQEEGWDITVDHGAGLITRYVNCGSPLVSLGQEIRLGDVIADVSIVLHFEVIKDGVGLNPVIFSTVP